MAVLASKTEVLGLTRRLVRYRSYTPAGAESTIDFINGWFEARGLWIPRNTELLSLVALAHANSF